MSKKSKILIVISGCFLLIMLLLLGLYINSPKNIANRALDRMANDYYRIEAIVNTAFIDFEENPVDINGIQYLIIKNECNSIEDLETLLQKVYTKKRSSEILSWCTDGERPMFTEFEGKLCRQDAYAMGTSFKLPITIARKINNEEIEIETVSEDNELFVIQIILKKEDGMWKISKVEERER